MIPRLVSGAAQWRSSPPHTLSNQIRRYTQQKTAPTARSTLPQSTSKPSPTSTVKNPSLPKAAPREPVAILREFDPLDAMERLARAEGDPRVDIWAQKFSLLDVCIPTPLTKIKLKENGALAMPSQYWRASMQNWRNRWQNTVSMYRMASEFAFPSSAVTSPRSLQIFKAQSTAPTAWMAPIREELLKIYCKTNEAIAKGDVKALKLLTAFEYQDYAIKLVRKRKSDLSSEWTFHREVSPCKVVSIRAVIGNHGRHEPAMGNRLVVHLVVRFESLQSLRVYNRMGQLLRPDGTVAAKDDEQPTPKRVLEYIVFENKMWYQDGWIIRGQIFEGVQGKYTVPT